MLKRILPRQDNFFTLFQHASDKLVVAANEFYHMLQHLDKQQFYVDLIARHEEEADKIAHASFELLHKSFITPFDRNDIHELTSSLDDIIDLINRIAQRFPFYQLQVIPQEMIDLSALSIDAGKNLRDAIYHIHALKNSPNIMTRCLEIDRIESAAHQVVLAGERRLFLEENDFKQFFKLKDIYGHIKLVINRCQDVANLIKGIVLEYS
jgi:uncharacterized protein